MVGNEKPALKPFRPEEWLRKTDLEDFFTNWAGCRLIEVRNVGDIPRSFRFNYKHFDQTLTVASLIGNDYDLDRAWLTAAFQPDPTVDLPFVNRFNNRHGLACASIDENGASVLHSHFPLCGLKRPSAELMLSVQISGFEKELVEFNKMRNERVRSASVN